MAPDLREQLQSTLSGSYSIERELGGGGMARVFVATDTALERRVVLKVLPPEMAGIVSVERFRREITVAAGLRHPHIVPLLAAGEAAGLLYFTMPYVEGESLRTRIAREGALPLAEAVRILREIADALAYAHGRGLVHRDIKPDNVLLEHGHATVTDFGVAKALTAATDGTPKQVATLTSVGMALGTPAYMAPEQAAADPHADHRADLYALGVVGYEMLAGAPPFAGRPVHELIAAHFVEAPEPIAKRRPELPPALAELVMRLLAKRPDDRPQRAAEVLAAIDASVTPAGTRITANIDAPSAAVTAAPAARRPHAALLAAGVVLALVLGGYGVRSLVGDRSAAPATADTRAVAPAPGVARSVAVLPFANTSGQTENEHFSDGLTDELIGALSKVRGLRVAARTSAFALKGRGLDVRTIADTLGVESVLEGSVRREGNRLRVSAQLVNAADNGVVWSDTYDREMVDVFAVQEEIARAIVGALNVRLSDDEGARLVGRPTENLEAYDLYLRGRYKWSLRTRDRLEEAIADFVEATQRDPTFALPYIALADAYVNMSNFDFMPSDVALARAKVAADRALELDPTLAEAYSSQGFVLASHREFAASEAAFRRSIELNANYPWSHHYYSLLLLMLGRVDEAIEQNRQALELDPLSLPANVNRGVIRSMRRDQAGAERELRRALVMGPTFPLAVYSLGLVLTAQGKHAEALPVLTRAVEMAPGFPGAKAALLYTYSRLGQQEAADSLLAGMRAAVDDNRSRIVLAFAHAVRRDNAAAFALLDRVEWDVPSLITIRGNPLLDGLRADPRYATMLGRMGLRP